MNKQYQILFAVICLFIILLAPEIVYILGGPDYAEAVYLVIPLITGVFYQFNYNLYVNIEFYEKKTLMISISSLFAAGINIILNFIFIPLWGYIAAAYTTMVCYGLLCLFHYLNVRFICKKNIYDNIYTLFIIVIFTITALIFNSFYTYNLVRYILIFILVI